jgi:beta-glucanase (GH16 family)
MPVGNLPGWTEVYTQDFNGSSLPSGWGAYNGTPGGYSPTVANWSPHNCSVSGGELHFTADGISSCGIGSHVNPQTYGMYVVRLKGDAEPPGDFSDIALLWPASNTWTAEIDFYEDMDIVTNRSQYNASMFACPQGTCPFQQRSIPNDGTQWHTYGVQWTPSGVTYLLDGTVVAHSSESPHVPMILDLQSQNLSGSGMPSERETMTVDWVAEYAYTPGSG